MITTCPECGKEFDILYPDLWRYRRGDFLCSYGCMRKHDKREEENGEMKRLKKDGSPAQRPGPKPKKQIIETPEGEFTKTKPEIPEKVATVKLTGPLNVETPEPEKIKVVNTEPDMDYEVSAIRIKEFGEFYYDKKFNSIDWRTPDGDELGLPPQGWKNLMEQLPKILSLLGVEM